MRGILVRSEINVAQPSTGVCLENSRRGGSFRCLVTSMSTHLKGRLTTIARPTPRYVSALMTGLIIAGTASASVTNAAAATLTVTIENVPSDKGVVRLGVCQVDEYLQAPCAYGETKPAESGRMVFEFADVAPGAYGISVLHDKNDNGKLDFAWYGAPKEGYGASNNPPPRMGPAKWEDIVFDIADQDTSFSIKLLSAKP
ncbi:MAG: DUF2141 domain-containing protein [Pseudomonadota bacterium]